MLVASVLVVLMFRGNCNSLEYLIRCLLFIKLSSDSPTRTLAEYQVSVSLAKWFLFKLFVIPNHLRPILSLKIIYLLIRVEWYWGMLAKIPESSLCVWNNYI